MKSPNRLDDQLTAVMTATAVACVLGMNVSAFRGQSLGRDGASAQSFPRLRQVSPVTPPAPAAAPVREAANRKLRASPA